MAESTPSPPAAQRRGSQESGGPGGDDTGTEDDAVVDVDTRRLPSLAIAGMAWSALLQSGSRVISVAVFVVLARVLAPDDFGLVALASVFVGLLDVPLRVSLGDALVQRPTLRNLEVDSAFWTMLAVGAALAVTMAAAARLVAAVIDAGPGFTPVLAALALALPLTAASVAPTALLRRRLRYRALTIRKLVADAGAGALAVGMALAGAGVWALVAKTLVQSVLLTALALVAVSWRPRLRYSWASVREIAGFGAWSVTNSVVGFASRHIDDLIVGTFLGAVALGYYVVAFQLLSMAVLLVTETVDSTAMSAFSRLDGDRERIGRGVSVALRANLLVVTAVATLTVALAPSLVWFMFGAQWMPAVDLVRILIVGSFIAPVNSILVTVMKSTGRPDLTVKLAVPKTVVLAVVMVAAAPFGVVWVALARLLLLVVFLPVNLWFLHRLCEMRWRPILRSALRVTAVAVGAGAVALAVAGGWDRPTASLARFVLAGVAGGMTYGAAAFVASRSDVRELVGLARNRRVAA
ncbi:MAG: oligosaccharide flippase family protein [Acidimicrobiales bacterium]